MKNKNIERKQIQYRMKSNQDRSKYKMYLARTGKHTLYYYYYYTILTTTTTRISQDIASLYYSYLTVGLGWLDLAWTWLT